MIFMLLFLNLILVSFINLPYISFSKTYLKFLFVKILHKKVLANFYETII